MQTKDNTVTLPTHDQHFSALHDKIDDLENRSRRSNVLFFGVDDNEPSETWDATEGLVREFCASKLGITVDSVARAHRLGRFVRDKKRPIIAMFFNDREIEAILNKGPKLKNTPFSISRDYSLPVREKRRKLAHFKKSVAKEGDRCRLVFTKLFVNHDIYVWDTENECAVRLNSRDNVHAALTPASDTGE
ncbi:hypothetical protein HPB48_021860 [Haemaphysalis longicornis]|uniref:Uncharacterized protein n=1 Tax=Haemaphysalis longicornis TaxID=44386 RepID=A0A9J6FNB0_HAELO|nr:hypothetical protein HPB48_021860 [Haemaphysalis longicornis]